MDPVSPVLPVGPVAPGAAGDIITATGILSPIFSMIIPVNKGYSVRGTWILPTFIPLI